MYYVQNFERFWARSSLSKIFFLRFVLPFLYRRTHTIKAIRLLIHYMVVTCIWVGEEKQTKCALAARQLGHNCCMTDINKVINFFIN